VAIRLHAYVNADMMVIPASVLSRKFVGKLF
jgi:hypothetical protein